MVTQEINACARLHRLKPEGPVLAAKCVFCLCTISVSSMSSKLFQNPSYGFIYSQKYLQTMSSD